MWILPASVPIPWATLSVRKLSCGLDGTCILTNFNGFATLIVFQLIVN